MPNWCDTTYKCVGDLKEVKELHRALKYIDKRKTTIVKNGFGKWWLGNLVTKLGGDWEKYRCRGEITDYAIEGNVVTIYQSTAWCEQEGVRECIEKKFPSIKVYYREEEPECEVYNTNDDTGSQETTIPFVGMSGLLVLALAYVCFLVSLAVEILPQILLPHRILSDGDGILLDSSSVI